MLERKGMTIFVANNGKEGFQLFKEAPSNYYDIILTDLRMPEMNGQEMVSEIRQYEENYNLAPTPIIIVTGILNCF
jgi:CheY-like chemotaxis protein